MDNELEVVISGIKNNNKNGSQNIDDGTLYDNSENEAQAVGATTAGFISYRAGGPILFPYAISNKTCCYSILGEGNGIDRVHPVYECWREEGTESD